MEKLTSSDSTFDGLVPNNMVENSKRWWKIFLVSIFVLFLFYVPYVLADMPATQDAGNKQIIAKYILNGGCENVLVGSSMLYTVKENYFKKMKFCNLSIPGGSASDGMGILENLEATPKLIVFEINASRLQRKDYVEMAKGWPTKLRDFKLKNEMLKLDPKFSITETESKPIREEERNPDSMLVSPPKDKDRFKNNVPPQKIYLKDLSEHDVDIQYFKSYINFARIMESRGAHVVFVRMPVALKNKGNALPVIDELFPGHALTVDLDYEQLRWTDDTHLDERSALIYARRLEQEIEKLNSGISKRK